MSQKLYCPECNNYLMASDGECHDCPCGWEQFKPADCDHEWEYYIDNGLKVCTYPECGIEVVMTGEEINERVEYESKLLNDESY